MRVILTLPFINEPLIAPDGSEVFLDNPFQAGAMLAGRMESEYGGVTKVVSVRMDLELLAFLDFVVERNGSKFSRNGLIIQLLRSGVAAAWKEMTEDEQDSFLKDMEGRTFEIPDVS
jgi:hypothetical protein